MIGLGNEGLIQIDLLTPLTADFYRDSSGYDFDEEYMDMDGERLDGADLAPYEEPIREMVVMRNDVTGPGERPCNLMDYFSGEESTREKVESITVSVKKVDGILYGCATLQLHNFLEKAELEEVCEYITGQYSDGWGEGFEQQDIKIDGGYLDVHFYQFDKNFRFMQQQALAHGKEINQRMPRPKLPRPKLKLQGHDGNIFSILGDAMRLLGRNGQKREADEMLKRVEGSGDYYAALGIISEYVETELSVPKGRSQPQKTQRTSKDNRER